MIKVGITGQPGFIGTHLYNKFTRIPFEDAFFDNEEELRKFVSQCDVIVHLAAVNRHHEPEYIYNTNITLVKKLIHALDHRSQKPHVIYSSSIQEDVDNLYGKSKKEGREMLAQWAEKNKSLFTGFVFPNIFGPFGDPFHNSFIATFSHQLTHGEAPKVEIDKEVPLLYVGNAVKIIIDAIDRRTHTNELRIDYDHKQNVKGILKMLESYKSSYFDNGIIPELISPFEINLFNTFRCYISQNEFNPVKLHRNTDVRGSFVETVKAHTGGQFSFSITKPGITRGNHFHQRKRFVVTRGEAMIRLRRIGTDEVLDFQLSGDEPAFVDMPIWYTHNITNIGNEDLYTLFWTNEFYDPEDSDTYFEEV